MAARLPYTLLLYLLVPYALCRLVWRARRQPAYLKHVPERFGYYSERPAAPVIWIHAVSVGETRAAEVLVRAFQEACPAHRILLTHMTPTGRETAERLFDASVFRCYLPYDLPGAVARFLDRFRPTVGIIMETEVWPNLIQACRTRDIPLYLVNARLSAKSQMRYRRFARLARDALHGLSAVAAQSQHDAERFTALGARAVSVTGNLKFDVAPPATLCTLGLEWRERYGARPVLLAASTREGEEALLLERWRTLDVPGALLVIVPRHPQRFDAVAQLLERSGYGWQRRSADERIAERTEIVLGDSMGEMFAYYSACDVAFVGGSLLPFGGQNMIEPCAVGKPVLFGPHTYNFSEAAEQAVAAGAARRVADADELMREARRLLTDPMGARRMGEAGIAFVDTHRGATERVLTLIRSGGTGSRLTPG
ncbi:MAG TPA: lipid IV(A) 3-deoxy-D-manno-octulosonic acid transferase [Burkholderiales bacterium]|jgi:3-deoxy-D-manno-octulosonic-acid transferase|nr:lipid IV(A) 3-deoxy-D-manno-octulosonic acid transferase [Burkholderiales bacterium]